MLVRPVPLNVASMMISIVKNVQKLVEDVQTNVARWLLKYFWKSAVNT
jgi:hypothetical protein